MHLLGSKLNKTRVKSVRKNLPDVDSQSVVSTAWEVQKLLPQCAKYGFGKNGL